MADDIAERVQRGVEWLDANGPADWHERVDLTDFDMSDGCRCVLGWTFADEAAKDYEVSGFAYAEYRFEEVMLNDFELGFDADEDTDYDALQHAWTTVIRERQDPLRPADSDTPATSDRRH